MGGLETAGREDGKHRDLAHILALQALPRGAGQTLLLSKEGKGA